MFVLNISWENYNQKNFVSKENTFINCLNKAEQMVFEYGAPKHIDIFEDQKYIASLRTIR
jgi:hypothetical protein